MRPVNLIPGSQRKGDSAALRNGWLSYAVIAVLVLVLGGVVSVVLVGNKITDDKTQVADLQAREAAAQARATQYAPYVDFAQLTETRKTTVAGLAQSRFDWERVLNELAIVIPSNVWLTSLAGNVAGDSSSSASGASGASTLASGVTSPSLTISGCATDQRAVASFLSALRDIDGVTRVGLESTLRSDAVDSSTGGSTSSAPSAGSGAGGSCSGTRPLVSFDALATFDAVQVGTIGTDTSSLGTEPTSTTPTTSTTTSTTPTTTAPTDTTSTTSTSTTPAPTTTTPSATGAPVDASGAPATGGSN